ncbi:MAG: adenosylcobinamide-GDP ribazoletransferase [Nitrospirota bacterium]
MRAFLAAWAFLTVVPLGRRGRAADEGAFGRSLAAFPLVGLALGAALAVFSLAAVRLFPPALVATLAVLLLAWLSGGLHLDGVADTADACGSRSREEALRIMKGSTIGTYGSLALFSVLGLKIAALAALPPRALAPALLAMPVLGRWAQVHATVGRTYAREQGTGKAFVEGATRAVWWWATVTTCLIAAAVMGPAGLAAVAVVWAAVTVYARRVTAWLGGVTGDTIGAAGEGAEVIAVLTWAAFFHVGARP